MASFIAIFSSLRHIHRIVCSDRIVIIDIYGQSYECIVLFMWLCGLISASGQAVRHRFHLSDWTAEKRSNGYDTTGPDGDSRTSLSKSHKYRQFLVIPVRVVNICTDR